jgi:hypothetical protein
LKSSEDWLKGNSAVPGSPLDEKAGMAEYQKVTGRAGFFACDSAGRS